MFELVYRRQCRYRGITALRRRNALNSCQSMSYTLQVKLTYRQKTNDDLALW